MQFIHYNQSTGGQFSLCSNSKGQSLKESLACFYFVPTRKEFVCLHNTILLFRLSVSLFVAIHVRYQIFHLFVTTSK